MTTRTSPLSMALARPKRASWGFSRDDSGTFSASVDALAEKLGEDVPARDQLAIFASVLWVPDDLIEIITMPYRRDAHRWVRAGDLPDLADELSEINQHRVGIHAGVLSRAGAWPGADPLPGWVAWADLDLGHNDPDAVDGTIEERGLPPPTMITNSGRGCHAYWRLVEPVEPAILAAFVNNLAALLGSDPVGQPRQTMRIPGGLVNWSPARFDFKGGTTIQEVDALVRPPRATVARHRPGAGYTLDEIKGGGRGGHLESPAG